jgi:hypothetical protein
MHDTLFLLNCALATGRVFIGPGKGPNEVLLQKKRDDTLPMAIRKALLLREAEIDALLGSPETWPPGIEVAGQAECMPSSNTTTPRHALKAIKTKEERR